MDSYIHTSAYALYVAPSQIPAAGLGVYTRDFIARNQRIDEYTGTVCSSNYGGGYVVMASPGVYIDAKLLPRCYMAMINDCSYIAPQYVRKKKTRIDVTPAAYYSAAGTPLTINCEFQTDGTRVWVYSTTDIAPGSELFVSYGDAYWR